MQKFSRFFQLAFMVMSFSALSIVSAHATIVLGTLSTEPTTPQANQSFLINLDMVDPSQIPIEDAIVLADFTKDGETIQINFEEQEEQAGTYQASVTLPSAGEYDLTMRDQTFRQEEAVAKLSFVLTDGTTEVENLEITNFIFPPTKTSNNLGTWLIWLIAVPIVAGIIVTVLVLMNPTDKENEIKS